MRHDDRRLVCDCSDCVNEAAERHERRLAQDRECQCKTRWIQCPKCPMDHRARLERERTG